MAEFINTMLEDTNTLMIDLTKYKSLIVKLAATDSLEIFYYLSNILKSNTSVRNLVSQESDIRMFFMTYFTLNRLYAPISEMELNQGYADIFLIKAPNITDNIPNILIEFKFLKQNDNSNITLITDQAKEQINKYSKTTKFKIDKKIILVFKGFDMVVCESI
jgi:hypothetical protein